MFSYEQAYCNPFFLVSPSLDLFAAIFIEISWGIEAYGHVNFKLVSGLFSIHHSFVLDVAKPCSTVIFSKSFYNSCFSGNVCIECLSVIIVVKSFLMKESKRGLIGSN